MEENVTITPGLVGELQFIVTPDLTAEASNVKGMAPVLATPRMISFMERVAHLSVLPLLAEGQSTVGTIVNIRHLAATPVGMEVRVRSELVEVDRRRLRFKVEAWDGVDKIGEGEHERFIVDYQRFLDGVDKKREK
jgi:fluoroacetyl-CoA thioesterase